MNACPLDFAPPRYTDCVATLQADDVVKPDCICQDDLELYVSASLGPACRDVDECASGVNNRCGAFSSCVNQNPTNSIGGVGYLCNCDAGYGCTETGDRNCTRGGGHMDLDAGCSNKDECATGEYTCRDNSVCQDTEGSYICPCADGFREEGNDCVDILECSNGSANCDMQCEELPGSYRCYCDEGYSINAVNPKECDQVDECQDPNACGDPNSSCTDTEGSFECACNTNWEIDTAAAPTFACKDRDECVEGSHTCEGHSECSNKEEGFECPCSAGYERTGGLATDGSDGSTSACTDIDECSDPNNNPCGENSTCDNIGGSYNCGCQDGFEDRDGTCQDILECSDPNLNDCHALATCTETAGSFECTCNDNYWGDGRVDGHCSSLSECDIDGVDVCGPDTECIEADEGFMCRCTTTGYYPDPDQAWPTTSGNELLCTLATCGPGEGACTVDKATGDITCTATRNYIQLPQCIDYDECDEINTIGFDRCGSLGNCNNLDQAYECVCIDGAQPLHRDANGNVIECENVNECNIPCTSRVNANCNDCLENVAACDDRTPDKNSGASTNYVCDCVDGYTTSFTFDWATFTFNSACVDEDECLGTAHNCGFNANCENRNMEEHERKFECVCEDGYTHDTETESRFYNCIDIEECSSSDLNSCDPVTQVCIEEEPGYTCQCAWGYHAEAVVGQRTLVCLDDDECGMPEGELDQDGTARMKCDVFTANPTSECSNNDGSYSCTCLTGYDQATMNSTNAQTCLNLDECDTAADYCAQTFECQNCTCTDSDMFTTGVTHECGCLPGFTKTLYADIEGSTPSDFTHYCKDDNECLTASTNNCDINHGVCTNIDGGYTCACATGYQTVDGADEGTECENIDECTTGEHNCHEQATCTDNDGSFTCACNKGWTGTGVDCIDFLECEDQRAAGYSFNAEGNSWFGNVLGRMNSFIGLGQDFIPCDDRAFCTEQQGSYLCQCLDGLTGDGYTCEDVDECSDATLNACAAPVDIDEDAEGSRSVTRSICSNIDVTGDFDETWTKGYSCACLEGLEGEGENCLDIDECLVDGDNTCHAQATCNNFFGRSKYELGYTCTCPDYLVGDGHACANIDECSNDLNNCGANTNCDDNDNEVSMQTDFTCSCMDGYEHDTSVTDMFSCKNIDECATGADNCAEEGSECTDNDGGWDCACIAGYHGDGVTCTDHDECIGENNGHFCGANTSCNNLPGTFECNCDAGFTDLENIVVEGAAVQVCSDIINCVDGGNACDADNAVCNEVVGLGEDGFGYTCSCNAGWTVTTDFGRTCQNEDECNNGNHTCDVENGFCTDTTGSFDCSCNTGYTMDDNGICQDDDECVLGNNMCDSLQGICHNNAGSYTCTCATGYQTVDGMPEGYVCEDTDECLGSNLCHADATCDNTIGSYTCTCNTGYEDLDSSAFSGSGDEGSGGSETTSSYFIGSNCVNVDECTTGAHACDVNASCTDNTGSYTCTCSDPWRVTSDEGRTCEDFDECSAANENECHVFASCTNTDGSYTCACNDGYETVDGFVEGTNCTDIDECATETDNCSDFADCENRDPGFVCTCIAGYRVTDDDGVTCSNEDECLNVFAQNECHTDLATCNDTEGTYTCECATGYEGDGFGSAGCQDIDECATGDHTCDANATCKNNIGSFACECNVGWTDAAYAAEPGFACVDIDECATESHSCDIHATCTDTDGSYTCACNDGYENIPDGIGHTNDCINIDECLRETDECDSINSLCVDDVGTYTCQCNDGWTNTTTAGMGEGSCGNWNECLNNDDNLCDTDEGRGGVCIDNDGAYTCECSDLAWSVLGDDGYACNNYDECSNPDDNDCDKEHATCDDTEGSYTCTCEIGWTNTDDDGATCNDVDECAEGTHVCDVNSTCQNTLGSYECHCNDGWTSDSVEADAVCTDIDECNADAPTHSCDENATCSNNDGSYFCLCNIGYYSATNSSEAICGDVDECAGASADGATPEQDCADNTTCENTTGSYVCNCNLGWESDNDGQTDTECVDVDECDADASLQHACDPNATCNNNDGSYNCDCNPGWYSESNEFDAICGDVDECAGASADGVTAQADCDVNSACRNTVGTYECDCNPGWYSGSTDADMVCEDHDECAGASPDGVTAMHACDENATCEDNDGSYFCNCNLGWYSATNGADAECANVDECVAASPDDATPKNSCDVNADCVDTDGSYECHCASGWKSDSTDANTVCVNVDECTESTHNTEMESCAVNSSCSDTDGSYECHCDSGWQNVDGNMEFDATCEDIDECADANLFECNELSTCVNTDGTYLCSCIDGYADVTTDAPGECRNIDECVELNEDGSAMFECADNSACSDMDGTYECICNAGFEQTETGHPAACRDYDECAGENGGNDCGENADCTNTDGGFECSCAFGYQDTDDDTEMPGRECELIINCLDGNNGGCSHHCEIPSGCQCPGSCWSLNEEWGTQCSPDETMTTVECGPGQMDISIDACLFDHSSYTMHLHDQTCVGSGSMEDGSFELTTALDDCGTQLEFTDDQVVFQQMVYGYAIAGDLFLGRPTELEFTCTYNTNYDTEGDDIVVANIDATTDRHGAGSFEFNVDFYTDSSYGTQSAASDVITVGEQVYFGVSAANLPSSVSFSIMDCTVTNTNGADLSYYIVENFCPDVYTRTDFSGENMQKDSVFLHYQAFKFTGVDDTESEEVLSCRVIVCNDADGDNTCANQPDCSNGRRRRSAKDFQPAKIFQIQKSYRKGL